jgi:hypothetical protein
VGVEEPEEGLEPEEGVAGSVGVPSPDDVGVAPPDKSSSEERSGEEITVVRSLAVFSSEGDISPRMPRILGFSRSCIRFMKKTEYLETRCRMNLALSILDSCQFSYCYSFLLLLLSEDTVSTANKFRTKARLS